MLASDLLGIGWSDVQWLVAALGVGLGFGLQEIVANFVSGLIVLAERPIRIGDVVTVGDVSGTVARIRARATMVVDFDNKEVLIPNKSFITDRVINWTLSNQTTRLLLKISVPTGADIALAQRVILETVHAIPTCCASRCHRCSSRGSAPARSTSRFTHSVDSSNKRLRVQHEINLAVERRAAGEGHQDPIDAHVACVNRWKRKCSGTIGGGVSAGIGVLSCARAYTTVRPTSSPTIRDRSGGGEAAFRCILRAEMLQHGWGILRTAGRGTVVQLRHVLHERVVVAGTELV